MLTRTGISDGSDRETFCLLISPHAITQLVKEFHRFSETLSVVIIPELVDHAFASYCAVARAFSLYTKKVDDRLTCITEANDIVDDADKCQSNC